MSRRQLAGPRTVEPLAFPYLSFKLCGQSSDGERALEPTRCWRCSFVRVGARRSTETGSARWFLFPTNTWEPPLLTWVVYVSARTVDLSASIGVRMENVQLMSKRTQKDAGEERVTAKSKPMMNLVSRCSERNPDVLASTASESPGKTRYESQLPQSSWTEQHLRTVRLVKDAYSSSYSEWNADEKWSSQEWTSDEVLEARTERPVNEQPLGLFQQHTDKFIVDDDDMDSTDMSLKSRSFLHRVNDRVRKMLDQCSKDATQDSNKHSSIW